MITIKKGISYLSKKLRNFVFKKRLGKTKTSAKIIFLIMDFLSSFEIYTNGKDTGNFDHYVPQFLLRNWKLQTASKKIYSWSKFNNSINEEKITEVAGEIDWDTTNSNGVPSDYISKKLYAELLEEKGSRVIKLINENPILNLTFLEESTFAVFMAHQMTRVPSFNENILRFLNVGYSKGLIKHEDFGNKNELLEKVVNNKIDLNYNDLVDESIPQTISGGKPQKILLSLLIASNIAKKMYLGYIHILEIPVDSNEEFVISDNPVIVIDFNRSTILQHIPWWEIGEKDLWILMPISPIKAVFYCKKKRNDGSNIEKESIDFVQLLNFGQYFTTSNKVYSRDKEVLENHLKLYSINKNGSSNIIP